jgi:predicted amidohydrolase
MKAVLAQLEPIPGDIATNLATVESVIARRAGTDLIVFPELFLSGYNMETVADLAIDVDGPEIRRIRVAAKEAMTSVVVGIAERTAERPANAALMIDSTGEVAGIYRKTHLFGLERDAFVPGTALEPLVLDQHQLGLMICFDVEFPEVARTLAARGAELLVTISANMEPFGPDHSLAARARALENGLPHLYVNRVGAEAGLRFVGESQAVNPWGRAIEVAPGSQCQLEVTVGDPGAIDPRLDYAGQLRPELYQLRSG